MAIESPESVLEMVKAQRGMMWLFIAKLGLDFGFSATRDLAGPTVQAVFWIAYLLVSITVSYFVFRLTRVIYGMGPAIVCAGLIFAPCAGSFAVLVINGGVMDRLRKLGVKVGFMGATAAQVAELEAAQKSSVLPDQNSSLKS